MGSAAIMCTAAVIQLDSHNHLEGYSVCVEVRGLTQRGGLESYEPFGFSHVCDELNEAREQSNRKVEALLQQTASW